MLPSRSEARHRIRSSRWNVKGADEVGQLAAAFNEMASVLGKSIRTREAAQKALQILNDDLENRVEKRTATLIQEVERRKIVEETLTVQNSFLDLMHRISFTAGMPYSPEQIKDKVLGAMKKRRL